VHVRSRIVKPYFAKGYDFPVLKHLTQFLFRFFGKVDGVLGMAAYGPPNKLIPQY